MLLNNRTLLFSMMLIAGLMALSLAVIARDDEQNGLKKWAGALSMETVAFLLVTFRGIIPDFLSILLANVLMVASQAMKLAAFHEYRHQPWPRWQCLAPVAGAVLLFSLLPYDDLPTRLASSSALYACQIIFMLLAVHADYESRAGRAWGLLYYSLAAMLPMLAVRAWVAMFSHIEFAQPHNTVPPNPMQVAAFACLLALNLLGSLGFILMIKERADREVRSLAMTDPLTRIFNRRALMMEAEREAAAASRNGLPLSLIILDIDHFKNINDQYGHAAGDVVLSEVAQLLASQLRKQDTFGRYGGEEFCILLPDTDEDGAATLAEKLRTTVETTTLSTEKIDVRVTISLGIASWLGGVPVPDFHRMLTEADRALYQAKAGGRNLTMAYAHIFNPSTMAERSPV